MKVLIVVDKLESAIGRLAEGTKRFVNQMDVDIVAVHPKRPDAQQLVDFQRLAKEADVIDFQYWKTAMYLMENFYDLIKDKPKILTHNNPYNLFENDWSEFDMVVGNNTEMTKLLDNAEYVPITIDLDLFQFNKDYTKEKTVMMAVARIEGKKGVKEVAEVCAELGYKFILVGRISDDNYFQEVMQYPVDFRENVSNEELVQAYKEAAVVAVNSQDDFESGPMPILEGMAMGAPILTRRVGSVPDWDDGSNMIIRHGQPEDIADLKEELKTLIENEDLRISLRESAWKTAMRFGDYRRSIMYQKLWHKVYSSQPLVSVIIPTYNRVKVLPEVVESIIKQDYQNLELIICDDGSTDSTEKLVAKMRAGLHLPIKYVNTDSGKRYGLAKARNLGVVEALGDILVFMDDRYSMEYNAVSEFTMNLYPKKWLFGNKGTHKKDFVENFSCIYRQDLIDAGMFNERIDKYGGMSQELRKRFERQGFRLQYVAEAKCKEICKSSSKYKRKDEIRQTKEKLWQMGLG